jgi:FkbH-like protein
MAADPNWRVLSIRVRDRFGDHGLVGVAITRDEGNACEIDTFLLSCRVIGRDVETALLSHLSQAAAGRGRQRLCGWFLPTTKNAPAREFYRQHGFELQQNDAQGSQWAFDLQKARIACPQWIKLTP